MRLGEPVVKPVFLTTAHERATSVVPDFFDVGIVLVQGCNRTVVVAGIEDDKIKEFAHLEVAPNAEIIIKVNLADPMLLVGEAKRRRDVRLTASIQNKLGRRSFSLNRR